VNVVKKKTEPKCGDCIHYCACQSWNIGNLANALSTTCANFETTQMFLRVLGIEPKEG
jgi:hypothetical protein